MTVPVIELHRLLSVDAQGRLVRKVAAQNNAPAGAFADHPASLGYRRVVIKGKRYMAHRVVFAMTNGRWPALEIDHINGIRDDNRPENLRECGRQENCLNRAGLNSNNKSGHRGVSWQAKAARWYASIRCDGRTVTLGRFVELQDAINAVDSARQEVRA